MQGFSLHLFRGRGSDRWGRERARNASTSHVAKPINIELPLPSCSSRPLWFTAVLIAHRSIRRRAPHTFLLLQGAIRLAGEKSPTREMKR